LPNRRRGACLALSLDDGELRRFEAFLILDSGHNVSPPREVTMRFERWHAVGLAVGLVLAGPEAALAQGGRAPARAVLFDEPIAETPGFVAPLATVMLRKGKPNHLLRADVRLEVNPFSGSALALIQSILVNGHSFFSSAPGEPGDAHLCDETSGGCAARASAWVDLDQAETAFPGEFRGQPLEIEVTGRAESSQPPVTIRLQVLGELTKK
jgi:hypothetical protein